jgi:hypothetical protein
MEAFYWVSGTLELSAAARYTTGHHSCTLESRWEKVHADSGVFLRGFHGQRSDPHRGWSGKFTGNSQVKIRQPVSRARMLMIVSCEGIMRSRLARTQGTIGRRRNTEGSPSNTVVL